LRGLDAVDDCSGDCGVASLLGTTPKVILADAFLDADMRDVILRKRRSIMGEKRPIRIQSQLQLFAGRVVQEVSAIRLEELIRQYAKSDKCFYVCSNSRSWAERIAEELRTRFHRGVRLLTSKSSDSVTPAAEWGRGG